MKNTPTRYHVSPATGKVGVCTAKRACRFGSHFEESADAERYLYEKQIEELQNKIKQLDAPPAKKIIVKKLTKAQKVKQLEGIVLHQELGLDWVTEPGSGQAYLIDEAVDVLSKYQKDDTLIGIMTKEGMDPGRSTIHSLSLVLDAIHRKWVDVDAIRNSDRNLLNLNRPFDSKNNFQAALGQYLVDNGTPVKLSDSAYGWEDFDVVFRHRDEPSEVVAVMSVEDDSWTEFSGTYATSDDYKVGVKGEVLYADGTNRFLRFEASFSDVIRGITRSQTI